MRLISSLLVATLAATTLTTSIAAACGGYVRVDPAPRVLTVSTHGVNTKAGWANRAFVVLEQSVKLDDAKSWKTLAPDTYDGTQIAMLSPLATSQEFTLVGPSGTRVVKTAKQVALAHSWQIGFDQSRAALEIPIGANEQFSIALPGRVTDAKWTELGYQQGTASTSWWLSKQGVKDPEYVAIQTIAGSDIEVIQFADGAYTGKSQLRVRRGDDLIGTSMGTAVGVVTTKGRSFLVVNINSQLGTLELPSLAATATARS